ncbi:hypothetical protein AS181_03640 [Gordonia sp. SGD-V-85]|nr:hypothetical protein AS181_03640 [Gordonia sp. SGD-V-85]SCB88418.1 hypothetical protein GA0061091_102320 [Gordonia sp. v-85]
MGLVARRSSHLSTSGLTAVLDYERNLCARGEPYYCSLRRPELAEAVTKGPGEMRREPFVAVRMGVVIVGGEV